MGKLHNGRSKCLRSRRSLACCIATFALWQWSTTFLCLQTTRGQRLLATPSRLVEQSRMVRKALAVDAVPEGEQDVQVTVQEQAGAQEEDKHILLVVLDDNPYLSGSTKAALKHAAVGAKAGNKVTAMVLPATPDGNVTNPEVLVNTLRWWFEENEVPADRYEELVPEGKTAPAALVAEAVDELECDQVVMSAEAVAKKRIDMPLLATFLDCPVLLVPE
mmetsp:Transcript_46864/g.85894  ORF Transcript_46864/g.85894 Transcript_46864/m.85894 type:complete len:219 (+) Transcript_46864:73-729(+)